jgi:hypothetical protein
VGTGKTHNCTEALKAAKTVNWAIALAVWTEQLARGSAPDATTPDRIGEPMSAEGLKALQSPLTNKSKQ